MFPGKTATKKPAAIPMLLSFLASSIDLLVSKSIDVDEAVFRERLQQRQIMSKRYGIE